MSLTEQIYAQALLLAGELEQKQMALLRVLCQGANNALASRLRDGLTPEDCKADFIAAASLYALAALGEADDQSRMEEFRAGDLTVRQSGEHRDAASRCLQRQADMMILPYLKDRFSFLGV